MASKSVKRFRTALQAAGLDDTIVAVADSTRTAAEAAAALGCEVGQIVKSLVFTDPDDRPLLVLAAGDVRVDPERIAALHGAPVSLGNAAFVRAATGYAIGGVPPLGHVQDLPTLIDTSLERWQTVWAAAGTPHDVFSITAEELARVTGARRVEVG
jgi:prolyl-tRNA editing enzyme YbaK/EbsC (Cys-tRNA(Pro) deacylase)